MKRPNNNHSWQLMEQMICITDVVEPEEQHLHSRVVKLELGLAQGFAVLYFDHPPMFATHNGKTPSLVYGLVTPRHPHQSLSDIHEWPLTINLKLIRDADALDSLNMPIKGEWDAIGWLHPAELSIEGFRLGVRYSLRSIEPVEFEGSIVAAGFRRQDDKEEIIAVLEPDRLNRESSGKSLPSSTIVISVADGEARWPKNVSFGFLTQDWRERVALAFHGLVDQRGPSAKCAP